MVYVGQIVPLQRRRIQSVGTILPRLHAFQAHGHLHFSPLQSITLCLLRAIRLHESTFELLWKCRRDTLQQIPPFSSLLWLFEIALRAPPHSNCLPDTPSPDKPTLIRVMFYFRYISSTRHNFPVVFLLLLVCFPLHWHLHGRHFCGGSRSGVRLILIALTFSGKRPSLSLFSLA